MRRTVNSITFCLFRKITPTKKRTRMSSPMFFLKTTHMKNNALENNM